MGGRRSNPAIIADWLQYCADHPEDLDQHTKPLETPYLISKSTEVGQFLSLVANTNALLWYDKLDFTPFPKVANLCALRPGDVAFDIGAHHGIWSLMLERIVGPRGMVVAFEPFAVHAKVAELNIELNDSDVRLYRCGIGERNERQMVNIGSDSISPQALGRGSTHVEIEVCKLDNFMHLEPKVLKIDIEGGEILVIPSIEAHLATIRSIYVQLHPPFFPNFVSSAEESTTKMMDTLRRNFPYLWIEHPDADLDAANDPQFIPTQLCSVYASKVSLNARHCYVAKGLPEARLRSDGGVAGGSETRTNIVAQPSSRSVDLRQPLREFVHNEIDARLAGVLQRRNLFKPNLEIARGSGEAPYMTFSTCSVADLLHPQYEIACQKLNIPVVYHRKNWEWAFILHHAVSNFPTATSARALGFAVGKEPIPAALIAHGFSVWATDAPAAIGERWRDGNQFSDNIDEIRFAGIVDQQLLRTKLSFSECDMNDIDEGLRSFDFCWSSCALEHLGSLEHGRRFVINSVEKTLRVGGIACHTTEFNLSDNVNTVEQGETVIYRKRDLDELIRELRARGHDVDELKVAPDSHFLDGYVDIPPFTSTHLKLELLGYVATSVGLIVRRGR